MKKLNIVTLGCSKNVVDSEHLAARAAAAGWQVLFDSNDADCQAVVINTCGFIGDAKEESIDTILQFAAARRRGNIERLYVIGCLSERYADELRGELPEVDQFFGARGLEGIVAELEAEEAAAGRFISTPGHYAYLKISEGCDRRCGFCAIPLIRGGHVSVPLEDLVKEAEELAAQGVKELIVIAQDTTFYGLDLYGERRLAELLKRLAAIEQIEWIRLHYAYPAGFPQDVIDVMRTEPKICKYIDIPLQHIADSQLGAMKRGLDGAGTRELIRRLRAEIPGVAIRTTMLVGYPGESESDFEELMAFVSESRFERLGVFPYSAEEGTYSADSLVDDVSEEDKARRAERLMELQAGISAELNASKVGLTMRVVVDRREGDVWMCRSEHDSPEVDNDILLRSSLELRAGDFVDVRIVGSSEFELFAEN